MRFFLKPLFCLILIMAVVSCQGASVKETPAPVTLVPTETKTETETEIPEPATEVASATDTPDAPTEVAPEVTEPVEPTVSPTDTPVLEPTVPSEVVIELAGAELPPGFSIVKYADVNRPTNLSFDAAGKLFVTNQNGEVRVFDDTDGDGRADFESVYAFGFDIPVGTAHHPENGKVYISSTGKISVLEDTDGDYVMDSAVNLVNGLPTGRHKNNNLKFGPDGWLYMGVGSTCDVCYEVDERSATVMRFDPESGASEVVATGLRNAYDIAFDPGTGALFATENGRDDLGAFEPLEELNHIVAGQDYGFPDCWDEGSGSGCGGTELAVGFFEARSSTNSIDFYDHSAFPEAYHGDMFAAVFGSWVNQEIGRGIWQVKMTPNGESFDTEMEWFLKSPNNWWLGMVVGPDGAIYVADYNDASVWRISYGMP